MCGRYSLTHTATELADRFGVQGEIPLAPRYNIAPTQPILIIREDRHRDYVREAAHVVWGLIPPWAKDTSIAAKMINARADSVAEKPAFRHAFKRRRCLVPVSGFYEWRKKPVPPPERVPDLFAGEDLTQVEEGTGQAQTKFIREPFFIHMISGELFAFAGLWEIWDGPNGETIESATILTTAANSLMTPIHDRMPVILPADAYEVWLDSKSEDTEAAQKLLCPYAADALEAYRVSSIVNSPRNDEPACSAPIPVFHFAFGYTEQAKPLL
jgi:putative SOS response-associated peptidase YedK